MPAARAGAACAPMSASRVWISAMRCGSSAACASAISAVRSVSAASTMSTRLCGPSGASCASRPMLARAGIWMRPLSAPSSPAMTRNSVVLPTPLRPTRPTRAPAGTLAEASSINSRPATRTLRSSITSMRAFWLALPRMAIPGGSIVGAESAVACPIFSISDLQIRRVPLHLQAGHRCRARRESVLMRRPWRR